MQLATSPIPLISVVIPAYNRSKTITYCLDSVLKQTVSLYEIIVVDDCSTDGTVGIVRNYKDPRIRCVVLNKNSGAQAARNRGIHEARGEWIAFHDSDDEWLSEKLEQQLKALCRNNFEPFTVVHTNCWRYEVARGTKEICNIWPVDGKNTFGQMLSSTGPMFPGILTSKAALEKIGFLDESVPSYQEWDTSIRLARECCFIHIREPLFVYHIQCGDTISKDKLRDIVGYQYIVDKFWDDIIQQCGTKVLNDHLFINALKAICWGYFAEAQKILEKTLGRSMRAYLLCYMARHKVNLRFCGRFVDSIHLVYKIARRITKVS